MQNAELRIFSKFSKFSKLPKVFFKKNSCFSSLISPLFCIFVRTKTSDYGKYGENLLRQ
jgi:hypothetical protein